MQKRMAPGYVQQPSRNKTLNQGLFNVRPPSAMLDQHSTNIVSAYRACWERCTRGSITGPALDDDCKISWGCVRSHPTETSLPTQQTQDTGITFVQWWSNVERLSKCFVFAWQHETLHPCSVDAGRRRKQWANINPTSVQFLVFNES